MRYSPYFTVCKCVSSLKLQNFTEMFFKHMTPLSISTRRAAVVVGLLFFDIIFFNKLKTLLIHLVSKQLFFMEIICTCKDNGMSLRFTNTMLLEPLRRRGRRTIEESF